MRKKIFLLITALLLSMASAFAQVNTVYVMKSDIAIFHSPVSDIDNVTFDEAASNAALTVHKNEGSTVEKILLNNIQQLSFSDDYLSVETLEGNVMCAFSDIAKLCFDITTGIDNPPIQSSFDVLVFFNSAGDIIVESPLVIKSLTLFGVNGKVIFKPYCNGMDMQCTVSLQNCATGIYLLRVETEQGIVVKKVVKPLNK